MGIPLAEYEGSNGNMYQIVRGADGVVYCNCWAWKMSKDKPRNCKHLDRFFAKGFMPATTPATTPTLPTPVHWGSSGTLKTASDVIKAVDPKVWDVKEGS